MAIELKAALLIVAALYQAIATLIEDRQLPPGQLVDVGKCRLHFYVAGELNADQSLPTIVLDHSLGGLEGYLLVRELAKLTRVCIYDRAGYGWSDHSPRPRTCHYMVSELDTLLTKAGIEPPYLLIGNSFGSYNARLYAAHYPRKVAGMVLTDGLHEALMLKMPIALRALQLFFWSGFLMSVLGSALGIVRLLSLAGLFEVLKPELRQAFPAGLRGVKRSFCRSKHWFTMSREIYHLAGCGRQATQATEFGAMPIVSIKAKTFFQPSLWTALVPVKAIDRLRDQMHEELLKLSTDCTQLSATKSGHFVWVDEPEVILEAVKTVLEKL
jgi:pimeloyl-ACP methyl ester carboxylesterase